MDIQLSQDQLARLFSGNSVDVEIEVTQVEKVSISLGNLHLMGQPGEIAAAKPKKLNGAGKVMKVSQPGHTAVAKVGGGRRGRKFNVKGFNTSLVMYRSGDYPSIKHIATQVGVSLPTLTRWRKEFFDRVPESMEEITAEDYYKLVDGGKLRAPRTTQTEVVTPTPKVAKSTPKATVVHVGDGGVADAVLPKAPRAKRGSSTPVVEETVPTVNVAPSESKSTPARKRRTSVVAEPDEVFDPKNHQEGNDDDDINLANLNIPKGMLDALEEENVL